MQVKCDRCGQVYEINDSRISPQGAKVKCPSCANVFVVRLPKANVPEQAPAAEAADAASKMQSPIKPKAEEESVAAPAQPEEEEWRIQHIGLTYTFHDLESLRNWLGSRQTLEGVKIARNKDEWKELGDYDVLTTELITRFFPLGDVPTTKSVKAMEAAGGAFNNRPNPLQATATLSGAQSPVLSGSSQFTLSGAPAITLSGAPAITLSGVKSPVGKATDLSTAVTSRGSLQQLKKERAKARVEKQNSRKQVIIFAIFITIFVLSAVSVVRYWRTGLLPFATDTRSQRQFDPSVYDEDNETQNNSDELSASDGSDTQEAEKTPEDTKPTIEELERLAEEDYKLQLSEAESMIKQKKWPEARATLENMYKEHHNDPDLLQLLAKTYRGLGMNDRAVFMETSAKNAEKQRKKLEKEQEAAIEAGNAAEDKIKKEQEAAYLKTLTEAKELVDAEKWPEARVTLEALFKDHQDDIILLQMLSETYRGLGMNDKAEEIDKLMSAPAPAAKAQK